MQVGVQYRSQWSNIMEGFTTMGATVEGKYKQLGLGFQLHQNHAGAASLKTTGLMLTGSYHKPLAQDGSLSLGLGLGKLQKQINPTLLTFDNQYVDGVGYDAALSNQETFERTKASFADFAAGLLWQGNWGSANSVKSSIGMSLSHIHLPNESLLGDVSELPMRTTVHGSLDMKFAGHFMLTPHFLFQKQGAQRELLMGMRLNGTFDKNSDFNVGMAYRWQDAVLLQVGMDIGNKSIWASYESSVSPLEVAVGSRGTMELGLYLRFNQKQKKQAKDSDGDGVFDNSDKCPTVAGLKENQGCPMEAAIISTDTDKDGVPDDLDQCPLEGGKRQFQGCNDSDGDGIFDHDDACPNIFGHYENKGCPIWDRDTDKDGVPDRDDYCVFIKGLPDLHGCPDTDKDGVSDIDDKCPYLWGLRKYSGCPNSAIGDDSEPQVLVTFTTDEAIIAPNFQALLDDFAQQVQSEAPARIIISGHTDAEGSVAYNYELGLRRAKAVKDYLRRQGVPAEQMEIISYGEAVPRRSNGSHEGRSENRRAEVALVK
jgi:type IX secretion system PorP/SprF family membrane protein